MASIRPTWALLWERLAVCCRTCSQTGYSASGTGPRGPVRHRPQRQSPGERYHYLVEEGARGGLVNVVEESSDRLGRWFARYGDDGAETFSARLLNGTNELGIAWAGDVMQLAANIAEVQGAIGRSIPRITGMASDGIEDAIKAGRFKSELYAKHLTRRLGGQWQIDVVKCADEDVWDIIATRIGN
jgi:hypothetical protein